MTEDYLTVGQLRAELVGVPDDVPVTLAIADGRGTGITRWVDATSAGYGPGVPSDEPAFSSAFPDRRRAIRHRESVVAPDHRGGQGPTGHFRHRP